MGFTHLLMEVYCDCNKKNSDKPKFCLNGINKPGSHCFENNCKFLSYTECANEIAYVGHDSIVESWDQCVGFGAEMEPDSKDEQERENLINKWKEICIKKISEAHDEYMVLKKSNKL
jgi:hypothetical protein